MTDETVRRPNNPVVLIDPEARVQTGRDKPCRTSKERVAMSDIRFALRLELDSDDPEFVRGCEVGRLQARVSLLPNETLREMVRQSNSEMLRRIAGGAGRSYTTERVDDEWVAVVINPVDKKHGLKAV